MIALMLAFYIFLSNALLNAIIKINRRSFCITIF